MMLCDYKYLMDISSKDNVEDISALYDGCGFKADVDGKKYNISKEAADRYKSYRNSMISVIVRIADVIEMPACIAITCFDNTILRQQLFQEVYAKSVFDKYAADSINYALEIDCNLFDNINLYNIDNKKIMPGDCLANPDSKIFKWHEKVYMISNNTLNTYNVENSTIKKKIEGVGSYDDLLAKVIKNIASINHQSVLTDEAKYRHIARKLGINENKLVSLKLVNHSKPLVKGRRNLL